MKVFKEFLLNVQLYFFIDYLWN